MNAQPLLPPLPWHGGCQCGQVSYRLRGAPLTLYCCHCTECQKQSASMFGMSMIVRESDVEMSGETHVWTRPTDSGNTTDCHFCPRCGSRVFHLGSRRRENGTLTLKAGAIDEIRHIAPVGHIWLKSAQAGFANGFSAGSGLLGYEAQPDSYDALIAAFRARYTIEPWAQT